MNTSRIASVAFALLLVTAAIGGPATQEARAWEMGTAGECDGLDYLVHITSFQQINGESCDLQFGDNDEMTTALDFYQQGETMAGSNDGFATSYENFATDTRSVAWTKAKVTIINNLNDGNTSSVTQGEANVTIDEYYARHERELVNQFDRTVRQFEYAYNAQNGSVSLNTDTIDGFVTIEVTLADGSTAWTRVVAVNGQPILPLSLSRTGEYKNSTYGTPDSGTGNSVHRDEANMEYDPPSGDYSTVRVLDNDRWYAISNDLDTQRANLKANVQTYVEGVYSEYQSGELNTTDLADPVTLSSQAATDYNSSGYYSYASISLASLGYSGNLNSSVSVSTANGTYDGTLFYTADDVSNFSVGQTYDPSTLNGTVYMAVQDGQNGTVKNLDETFTVESATNPTTGENMTDVAVEEYTYTSTNTSKLASELDRLRTLRDEYEDMNSSGGGGSNSGASSNLLLVLLAGAAGAAILIGRQDGGGRRGRR